MSIAVFGARGFVGSALVEALKRHGHKPVEIVRGDDWQRNISDVDVVIHAANPARRFRAEQNPLQDFRETVLKTAQFLSGISEQRFVLISTLSCRTQIASTYGSNRKLCEDMAIARGGAVVRLGPMFGGDRKRDTLHDILLGNKVFVAKTTQYGYVDVAWAADYVARNLPDLANSVVEIGAKNSVELGAVARHFGSASEFGDRDDTQVVSNFDQGPDVGDVFAYAQAELERINDWRY